MKSYILQFERLKRHYEVANATYDWLSLLDLSSTLRHWIELKNFITEDFPVDSQKIIFTGETPAKKLKRYSSRSEAVFIYFPNQANIKAVNIKTLEKVNIFSLEGQNSNKYLTHSICMTPQEDSIQIGHCITIYKDPDSGDENPIFKPQKTRMKYADWLAAECIRMYKFDTNDNLVKHIISRELLINIMANHFDGSHSSRATYDGKNDVTVSLIESLMNYKILGLVVPYFVIIKIAHDIIESMPKIIPSLNIPT